MDIDLTDLCHSIANGTEQERREFTRLLLKMPVAMKQSDGTVKDITMYDLLHVNLSQLRVFKEAND